MCVYLIAIYLIRIICLIISIAYSIKIKLFLEVKIYECQNSFCISFMFEIDTLSKLPISKGT